MPAQDDLWLRPAADFPSNGSLEDQARFLIGYAVLAPSGHNTQPWLFGTGPSWIDVIADRTRALPVVDPNDRELTISCGAAIGILEIAARRFSLDTDVQMLPDAENGDHLARIALSPGADPDGQEVALFDAIKSRRTDRNAYFLEELPGDLFSACGRVAETHQISARPFIEGDSMEAISELVAEGDRLQFDDPSFRRELAAWLHSARMGSRDGMSGQGFGMPDILAPAARLVIRTFDLGGNVAAADKKKILAGSPALMLLASQTDEVSGWLNTGRALAKILLMLASRGFSASYLNQPIEVAHLRPALKDVAQVTGLPQILIRVGRSETPPTASVRRALSEVLITS